MISKIAETVTKANCIYDVKNIRVPKTNNSKIKAKNWAKLDKGRVALPCDFMKTSFIL